ncbi:armadillo-type protein [Blastocladiella britannica]|nr:armadillo-type protein [Blastocladiella britannica]
MACRCIHDWEVLACHPIPRLVSLLRHPSVEIVIHAARALLRVSGPSHQISGLVIHSGAVPILMDHLSNHGGNCVLRNRAVDLLGNLFVWYPGSHDVLLDLGIVERFVELVTVESVALCDPSLSRKDQLDVFAPALQMLMRSTDDATMTDASNALEQLIGSPDCSIGVRVAELFAPPAVSAFEMAVCTPVLPDDAIFGEHYLSYLGYIFVCLTTHGASATQVVVDAGFLNVGIGFLAGAAPDALYPYLLALSFITKGTLGQVLAVVTSGMIPVLIDLLMDHQPQSTTSTSVCSEVAGILWNVVQSDKKFKDDVIVDAVLKTDLVRTMYTVLESDLSHQAAGDASRCIVALLKYEVVQSGPVPAISRDGSRAPG